MSFLAKILGSAVGETVKGIGEGVSTLANGLRSVLLPVICLLVLALLGLGAARSYEKVRRVQDKH